MLFKEKIYQTLGKFIAAVQAKNSQHASSLGIGQLGNFHMVFRKGTSDEHVLFRESFDHDFYYTGVPEYHPNDYDVIIDVGAYIGTFSILSAQKACKGKVYAIEASQESFQLLKTNIVLNKINNVEAFHIALGERTGSVKLYLDKNGTWGNSTSKNYCDVSEEVECFTLEAFLKQNKISKCSFMKLNCEGAEYPILLNSSEEVLKRFNVILVLYHNDLWLNNSEFDLIKHLDSCGFSSIVRNKSEKRGWIIALNRNPT